MRTVPAVPFARLLLPLLLAAVSGCCCPKVPPTPPAGACDVFEPGKDLEPKVTGHAIFYQRGGKRFARFFLRGDHATSLPLGVKVEVQNVSIYSSPGEPAPASIIDCAHLVRRVEPPYVENPLFAKWRVDGLETEWDHSQPKHTLVFRYVYEITNGGTKKTYRVDQVGTFKVGESARGFAKGAHAPGSGSTEVLIDGGGTFFGGQNLALYDLEITYDASAERIEIYSGPTPGSGTVADNPNWRILTVDPAPALVPPATVAEWSGSSIRARYDGTSPYYQVAVKVTFSGGSPAPITVTGDFDAAASLGTLVPMTSYAPVP